MKPITEALKKLDPKKMKDFSSLFDLKKTTGKEIIPVLLSISGIDIILSSLSLMELKLLRVIYDEIESITFGEIEKKLSINISDVERITYNLSQKLLTYTIKNRQLLTKKLDKVYKITEISSIINMADISFIKKHLVRINSCFTGKEYDNNLQKLLKDKTEIKLLRLITELGGFITLDEAKNIVPQQAIDKTISSMIDKSFVYIFHVINSEYNTYIVLNEKIAPFILNLISLDNINTNIRVHNRYNLIINLLKAFDTISTYGLFLTKQMKFRKIDIKRITESMLKLTGINDDIVLPEEVSRLSIFLLNKLKCLNLSKDIANISLLSIKKEIERPEALMMKVLDVLNDSKPGNRFFTPPFEMPSYNSIINIIETLWKLKEISFTYFKITVLTGLLANSINESTNSCHNAMEIEIDKFNTAIHFLSLAGIIEIKNNLFMLSDIGKEITGNLLSIEPDHQSEKIQKCIYINPDFTLIIPVEELPSEALYHLLTHTEIVKDDIILHAVISKSSIVKTHKRRISLKGFMKTLKKFSKNDIPQNLSFLLNEWSNQTIKLNISNSTLLKTSHSSFIDEILFSKIKNGIIERISPNYALISKEYIDDIVKLARKNDAVITLFEDSE